MFWESPASRWSKPFLSKYLEAREEVNVATAAFSGILSHPFILSGPYMLGSTFWDLALTDRRIIAVERPFLPIFRRSRKVLSFPLGKSSGLEIKPLWGINAILHAATQERRYRFKLVWFPSDVLRFTKALSQITSGAEQ